MNQLTKELISFRQGIAKILTTILKSLIFIFTKLKVTHIPTIAKFINISNNTIKILDKYIPKIDKELVKLRKKNSFNSAIRGGFSIIFFLTGLGIGTIFLLSPNDNNFLFKLLEGNPFYILGLSITCFFISIYLISRRYSCPVCYCEKAIILDTKHIGSKSHYENWFRTLGGYIEEHRYKVGTTNYYTHLVKCSCCGHISEFNRKEFVRR